MVRFVVPSMVEWGAAGWGVSFCGQGGGLGAGKIEVGWAGKRVGGFVCVETVQCSSSNTLEMEKNGWHTTRSQ